MQPFPTWEKELYMRELFESLTSNMKGHWTDPASVAYTDPETGEDVYDPDDLRYFYRISFNDFLEMTKNVLVPDGIQNDALIEDTRWSICIWTAGEILNGEIGIQIDKLDKEIVIYDYDSIEDKHLYTLIDLVRKEVSVPSR